MEDASRPAAAEAASGAPAPRLHRVGFWAQYRALLAKDVRMELRTREMVVSMGVYALLVLTVYGATMSQTGDAFDVLSVAAGLLWAMIVFTSLLGLNRSFANEVENGCLEGVLLAPVSGAFDPLDALLTGTGSLLELVDADGAILRVGDISKSIGFTPTADRSELLDAIGIEPFATDALPATHPGLAALLPGVGGLLVVPVGLHGVAIFLRREVTQVVRWLGDQSDANRDTPLSPRRSFSAWSESVSGTALPWGSLVEEARVFGRELAEALDRRDDARLAELALIDPLTGLQNRRSLLDRLEKAVAEGRPGCLMFLDLDRFKSVNDRFGHETGDVVLRSVAGRLSSISRSTDTIARLGGDEFVVLCLGVEPPADELVARRMVDEIGQPIAIGGGREIVVTASCGVVPLDALRAPDVLLDAADAAMYRAKNSGRNRASL